MFLIPPKRISQYPSSVPSHGCDIAYLLDVVVGESTAILELLAGEDQALLVRWNALLILDLRLDIVDGVGGLDLKGDGLARKGLDEAVGALLVQISFHVVGFGLSRSRFARVSYICTTREIQVSI